MAAWQAWLLLFAIGGAAAWLFLRKLRPPRVFVPSMLFWRRVLDESRQMTLWERIRRAVSLALTVIIAIALGLAIARPARRAAAAAASRGRLLIVIDSSWSMQARTRNGETRWDRAIAQARRLAASAAGDPVMLATTADGVIEGPTTDLALIEAGLDRIQPAGGEGTAWPRIAATQASHFITDGTVPRPLDADVIIDSVFEPAANVAVTALDVRPALEPGRVADAYLEIANFAPSAQVVRVVISRGPASVFDKRLDVGPGEALRQVVPITAGGDPTLRVRVDAKDNALDIDDEAVAFISEARTLSVVVVGRQTTWLTTLLRQDPGLRVSAVADPASYHQGQEDVVIFDRCAPAQPPGRPALYVTPPASAEWLGGRAFTDGSEEKQPRWKTGGGHPLLRGVDLLTLTVDRVHAYRAATLETVAESQRGTPLLFAEDSVGRRSVLVAFGPSESNLASAPAFPVLMGNAIDWLARPETGGAHRPGEVVLDQSVTSVTGPGGVKVPIQRVNQMAIAVLRAPGLYVAEGGGSRSTLAVNVGDPQVSNVQRSTLTGARANAVTAGASSYPWWLYCGIAAFGLILLEWWTWQRRITV